MPESKPVAREAQRGSLHPRIPAQDWAAAGNVAGGINPTPQIDWQSYTTAAAPHGGVTYTSAALGLK